MAVTFGRDKDRSFWGSPFQYPTIQNAYQPVSFMGGGPSPLTGGLQYNPVPGPVTDTRQYVGDVSFNVGGLPTGYDSLLYQKNLQQQQQQQQPLSYAPTTQSDFGNFWGQIPPTGGDYSGVIGGTGVWQNTGEIAPETTGTYTLGAGQTNGDIWPVGLSEEPKGWTLYDGYELPWYRDDALNSYVLRFDDVPVGVNIYETLDKYNIPYQITSRGIYMQQGYLPPGLSETEGIDPSSQWYQEWLQNENLRLKKEKITERQEFMDRFYMPNWYMDLVSWRGW